MKKKLALAAGIFSVLIFGFFMGVWATGRGYEKYIIAPGRHEKANLAAIRVQNLSLLRIGATEDAIHAMETMLDNETLVLTQETTDPEQLPEDVVRALKQIKTYREIYPPEREIAGRIGQALVKIPRVSDYKNECQAGLCRLLEFKKQEVPQSAGTDNSVQP